MNWNDHSRLQGQHAFLGASKYHWINYDAARIAESFINYQAKERGTRLHAYAAESIALGQKLPRSKKTLNSYVNDAIGFCMTPEVVLYYSENCYGTADTIHFANNFLRIHDLKTGLVPAHMEQLFIYDALFCLEYGVKPRDIQIENRIYQNDDIWIVNPTCEDIDPIGNVFKKIWEVGKNIGQGLWNGVTSVASGIWNGIKGLGSWIVNGFKSIFGIHSPSTVMAELGAYMGQGFANGITSTEDGVNRSMDDMTSSALDIATNAAQMLYDVATGQETAEPIFTPVLNLSDYASPTSWAATQAYTPSAETAERVYRSNELAQRIGGNQNGVLTKFQSDNSDVVNAISQLGNRVDRMAESISKMKLVLDSGKTVGELAPKIDSNMGGRNILAERGVI